ncbi:hypothetical protein CASFOL_008047 [Castilleja foliolosa]|uniref:CCHC-type domain-containing protein n=1 Tax=Castilleja foliolosa TaxID=1961234 RepID=A0ABD3E216_9LAMI
MATDLDLSAMSIETQPLECTVPDLTNEEKETTLIAKILTHKTINMNAFKSTIIKAWNPDNKISTNLLADNTMAFVFESIQDLEKVCNASWTFRDHQVIIARWPPDKAHADIDLDKTSLWVHAIGVPVAFINANNARAIGNTLGRFIKADLHSPAQKWKKSLRLQIEIDIAKPLASSLIFSIAGRAKISIEIRYERISDLCFKCGRLGHKGVACNFAFGEDEAELFGPWLKFENLHIPNPKFKPLKQPEDYPFKSINKPSQKTPPSSPMAGTVSELRNPNSDGVKPQNTLSLDVNISDALDSGQNQMAVDSPIIFPENNALQNLQKILKADYTTKMAFLEKVDKEEALFTLPACDMLISEKDFSLKKAKHTAGHSSNFAEPDGLTAIHVDGSDQQKKQLAHINQPVDMGFSTGPNGISGPINNEGLEFYPQQGHHLKRKLN